MKNSDLRKRSRRIWMTRFPSLLPLSILALVNLGISQYSPRSPLAALALYAAILILSAITSLLSAGFCLNAWQGEKQTLPRITLRQIGRTFMIMLLTALPLWLAFAVIASLAASMAIYPWMDWTVIIAFLVGLILLFWLALRLSPLNMLIFLEPDLPLSNCLKTTWTATGGRCGRILCMSIILLLPQVAVSTLLDVLRPAPAVYQLVMGAMTLVYSCYVALARGALSLELLDRNPILPEDL